MKKKMFLLSFILLLSIYGFTQSLIKNGGFEKYKKIIVYRGNSFPPNGWYFAGGWRYRIGYTRFHLNGKRNYGTNNLMGNQQPKHGLSYSIITPYGEHDGGTFYITHLTEPLKADSCYYIEYSVSRTENSGRTAGNIDACLTSHQVLRWFYQDIQALEPSFRNPLGLIKDSINWTTISGTFIAKGGEKYLVLGNFEVNEDALVGPCDWDKERIKHFKNHKGYVKHNDYFLDDVILKPYGWNDKSGNFTKTNFSKEDFLEASKNEFCFELDSSGFQEYNRVFIDKVAKKLQRDDRIFVELCATAAKGESIDVSQQRLETLYNRLIQLGVSDNQISLVDSCNNDYKVFTCEFEGRKYVIGSIEVIFR